MQHDAKALGVVNKNATLSLPRSLSFTSTFICL
jgi:hypothetical protein